MTNTTVSPFIITPPSQEEVDTHASLEPYKVTPSGEYRATLGTATREGNDSQTWVAVGLPVAIVTTVNGEEVSGGVNIAGRSESTNVSTELFVRSWDDGQWVGMIGDDGEPVRRTDDGVQTAYSMGYKLFVQLFQALGVISTGDTDLSALGFINDFGLFDADAIVEALSSYEGAELGVQIRNQAQKRKGTDGKKITQRDSEGRVRREAVITDFFTLS